MLNRQTKFIVATCLILALGVSVSANTLEDMESVYGGRLPVAWQYDSWPEDNVTKRGFAFTKSAYAVLDDYEQTEDVTSVEPWWDIAENRCLACVERKLKLTRDGEWVKVTIGVYPSNRYWKLKFAYLPKIRTIGVFAVPGPAHDISIGDFVMLNDRPGNEEEAESWQASECRNLTFMVANIMIDISATNEELDVISLAKEIVEQIAQQEDARVNEERPLAPTVTLSFSEDSASYTEQNRTPVRLPVEVEVDDVFGGEKRAAFEGLELSGPSLGYPKWIPFPVFNPGEQIMYGKMSRTDSVFDSITTPTDYATHSDGEDRQCVLSLIVWGDNLVPSIASDTFTVDTP